MIALWLLSILCFAGGSAHAQSAAFPAGISLPDVTLFGRDTVYLPVPPPRPEIALPTSGAEAGPRLRLPFRHSVLSGPPPPEAVRPAGGGGLDGGGASAAGSAAAVAGGAGPGSLAPASDDPRRRAAGNRDWLAAVQYVPAASVAGSLAGGSARGPWSTESHLDIAVPDGWLQTGSDTVGRAWLSGRLSRDGGRVAICLAAAGGLLEPPVNPRTYTLAASQRLAAAGSAAEFSESTAVHLHSRDEPTTSRTVAARQEVGLQLDGGRWGLAVQGAATLRQETGLGDPTIEGLLTAMGALRSAGGSVRVAAGASTLSYADRFALRPAVSWEIYPLEWLSVRGSAETFLRLAPRPDLYAVHTPAGDPLLRTEGGYHVQATVGVDLSPGFAASVSGRYLDGRVHVLDGETLGLEWRQEAGGALDLGWRSRSWFAVYARAAADWDLERLPVPARRCASARLEADFSNAPLALIMRLSWGDLPAAETGEVETVLGSPWQSFRGLEGLLQARLRVRDEQAVLAGVQLLAPEKGAGLQTRVLLGYRVQLRAAVGQRP